MRTKINTEFKSYTFEEFNKKYGTAIDKEMDLEELTDWLEGDEISYMYASYNHEDVLENYADFHDEIGHICELVEIEGIYLALL